MIGFKFVQRFIGIISTVILARLLIPEDFGLVAMAMALYAFVQLIGSFGFDMALIQNQQAERRHYDTAWTLNLFYGFLSAAVLTISAPYLGNFFDEPRVEGIVYAFGVIAVVQGFENIGIVAFRKELNFDKEFWFQVWKKLTAFVVTVTLAFALRSYWALVAGILASRFTGVVLSYWLHPFRPWFGLSGAKDLFSFSGWIVLNNLLGFFRSRGPDFILARVSGAAEVGLYRISKEVSNLPTTELTKPIMRAVFPGYSKVANDPGRLRKAFLDVQGTLALITVPAGLAIVSMADPIVRLVLGAKWLDAIPLIQVIGIYGVVMVLRGTSAAAFMAVGKPYWIGVLTMAEMLVAFPLLMWLLMTNDLAVSLWAFVVAGIVTTPLVAIIYRRLLGVSFRDRFAVMWRPFICGPVVAGALFYIQEKLPSPDNELQSALQLLFLSPAFLLLYSILIVMCWGAMGRPTGPETRTWELLGRLFPRASKAAGWLLRKQPA